MKSFKLSNDRRFAEKLEDLVDLYLHPPPGAVVISVDEKCQIQALDRTQPCLPWKKGRCGTMTHDYKRHGTTTLFAGMNVADGSILSTFMPTHNHQDWIRFLKLIQKQTPQDKNVARRENHPKTLFSWSPNFSDYGTPNSDFEMI